MIPGRRDLCETGGGFGKYGGQIGYAAIPGESCSWLWANYPSNLLPLLLL
jgi:hypothetical protein